MFNIYKLIATRLRNKLPQLGTIDADKGQLANPEQTYPLNYPAVLIDLDNIDWKNLGQKTQKGSGTIGITVAVQTTGQSHEDAPDLDRFIDEMEIVNEAFTVLNTYLGLSRIRTHRQKRLDAIQVYTHIFKIALEDKSAMKTYIKNPTPPKLKMYTPQTVANFPEELK